MTCADWVGLDEGEGVEASPSALSHPSQTGASPPTLPYLHRQPRVLTAVCRPRLPRLPAPSLASPPSTLHFTSDAPAMATLSLSVPSSFQSQGLCTCRASAWITLSPEFCMAASSPRVSSRLRCHLLPEASAGSLITKPLQRHHPVDSLISTFACACAHSVSVYTNANSSRARTLMVMVATVPQGLARAQVYSGSPISVLD